MPNPTATFDTSMGKITAEIYLDRVPITASNFIDLCQSGFYNGIHFHRVIPNFMNQFGCPYAKDPNSGVAGMGGPPDGTFKNLVTGATEERSNGGNIKDEHISEDSNKKGSLSMANTGQPNSGGSQFFMNVHDNAMLDWFSPGSSKHPVFGMITSGYDVCEQISRVETDEEDRPKAPIVMNSVTISSKDPEIAANNSKIFDLIEPSLQDRKTEAKPAEVGNVPAAVAGGRRRWTVVGGADKGGIIVRKARDPKTAQEYPDRLQHGAVVEELGNTGERLWYRRITGTGPEEGWVSLFFKGNPLVQPYKG